MGNLIRVQRSRWGKRGFPRNWTIRDSRVDPPVIIAFTTWGEAIREAHRLARTGTVQVSAQLRGITRQEPY